MSDIFATATRKKLRFHTPKGVVTSEDLWDLTIEELDKVYGALRKDSEETESYVEAKNTNVENAQKIKVVTHILDYRFDQADKAQKSLETRQQNQRIDELIRKKRDQKMEELSIEELESMKS